MYGKLAIYIHWQHIRVKGDPCPCLQSKGLQSADNAKDARGHDTLVSEHIHNVHAPLVIVRFPIAHPFHQFANLRVGGEHLVM